MFPKRKFISAAENAAKLEFCHSCDSDNIIIREKSVVDEFYFETRLNSDGTESVCVSDPIRVLFNQQRLDEIGATAVKAFLDGLQKKNDSLAELRSKCSDEDLMQMMKSRHLQSPSEILAWCRYMESNISKFNTEVQKLVAAEQQQQTTEKTDDTSQTE